MSRLTAVVAADPGVSGGLAIIGPSFLYSSPTAYCVRHTPVKKLSKLDIFDWIKMNADDFRNSGIVVVPVIELVGGYVGEEATARGSQMFTFGASFGNLEMALAAALRVEEPVKIRPQEWQKGLGIAKRTKQESPSVHKNKMKTFAQRLFPQQKVTLAVADALCIAWYHLKRCNRRPG